MIIFYKLAQALDTSTNPVIDDTGINSFFTNDTLDPVDGRSTSNTFNTSNTSCKCKNKNNVDNTNKNLSSKSVDLLADRLYQLTKQRYSMNKTAQLIYTPGKITQDNYHPYDPQEYISWVKDLEEKQKFIGTQDLGPKVEVKDNTPGPVKPKPSSTESIYGDFLESIPKRMREETLPAQREKSTQISSSPTVKKSNTPQTWWEKHMFGSMPNIWGYKPDDPPELGWLDKWFINLVNPKTRSAAGSGLNITK